MPAAHARKSTANPQKVSTALLASAAAVSASIVVAGPQAKAVAAQLPEISRQVKLTAVPDPLSLVEGLLALPTSVAQQLLGAGQSLPGNLVPNATTNAALAPAFTAAVPSPQDLIGSLGGILTSALSTVWNDGAYLASIPINIGAQTAISLLYYGAAAVFHPDLLFSLLTSYIPNYVGRFVQAGIGGFISTTTQFLTVLADSLGSLLPAAAGPLAAANVSKLQTASAVTPAIHPSVAAPQDLIGGLGSVVSSAVSMVANDVAYAVNLPLAVAVPVVVPLVAGLPYTLAPQVLAGLLTTNLPNALRGALANTVNEIVSQAGQFVSSLGGLVPAAAAPLAATSVPKVQTNLIKVSNPSAAPSASNTTADSKPDKAGSNDKSKPGSDKTRTDTKSDKGGRHRKPTDSGDAGSAGEIKGGNSSHDSDGSKHSSDKSGSSSHGTGDGHGGSGGHRGGK